VISNQETECRMLLGDYTGEGWTGIGETWGEGTGWREPSAVRRLKSASAPAGITTNARNRPEGRPLQRL